MRLFSDSARYASTDAADGRIVFRDIELVGFNNRLQYRTKLHRPAMRPAIFGTPHGRQYLVLRSTQMCYVARLRRGKNSPRSENGAQTVKVIFVLLKIAPPMSKYGHI